MCTMKLSEQHTFVFIVNYTKRLQIKVLKQNTMKLFITKKFVSWNLAFTKTQTDCLRLNNMWLEYGFGLLMWWFVMEYQVMTNTTCRV